MNLRNVFAVGFLFVVLMSVLLNVVSLAQDVDPNCCVIGGCLAPNHPPQYVYRTVGWDDCCCTAAQASHQWETGENVPSMAKYGVTVQAKVK